MAVKFSDINERLLEKLGEIEKKEPYASEVGEFMLLQGFIMQPIQQTVGADYIIGGEIAVPLIMAVGKNNKQVYYFPLVELLPDLKSHFNGPQ